LGEIQVPWPTDWLTKKYRKLRIPVKPNTDSAASRTPIPVQAEHHRSEATRLSV
jgi:hypothetical protein